ncbi:hypothetical protein LTR70_000583 [Exophiala xenobiotica]|nr:hypothetical protein LTR70_000583 [Exophiala xenobiotica]
MSTQIYMSKPEMRNRHPNQKRDTDSKNEQEGLGTFKMRSTQSPTMTTYLAHGDGSYPDFRARDDYGSEWQQQHEEEHQCDHYAEGVIYDGDPSYAEG